jgi:hypothetical protein
MSDPGNAVLGSGDFAAIKVAANAVTSGTLAPPDGVQGDACAELAALSDPGKLAITGRGRLAPGDTVTVTGQGYRSGESVAFTIGSTSLGSAIAGTSGAVSFRAAIPSAEPPGPATISGVGAGSGYTSTGQVLVTK